MSYRGRKCGRAARSVVGRVLVSVLSLSALLGVFAVAPNTIAQEFPEVSSTSDLATLVEDESTGVIARVSIPASEYHVNLFAVAYDEFFESSFINSLDAVTNGSVVMYPLTVTEEKDTTRRHVFHSNSGQPVLTNQVSFDRTHFITNSYGEIPPYLSPSEQTQWILERETTRGITSLELFSSNDLPALMALLTNSANSSSGTNLLELYSNVTAVVAIENGLPISNKQVFIHSPTNILTIDVFKSTDLVASQAWSLVSVLSHHTDPVLYTDTDGNDHAVFTASDDIDHDSDGIGSGREVLLHGMNPFNPDEDNDGLLDGLEIYSHSTDPFDPDSDGDGITDGDELSNGLNPTEANTGDSDLDWFSDVYEVNVAETDPLDDGDVPTFALLSTEVPTGSRTRPFQSIYHRMSLTMYRWVWT